MKKTKYKVTFLNGNEQEFYCSGVWAAWAEATHYANEKAWDSRVKYIYDTEGKTTYSKFNLTYNVQ